MTTTNKDLSDFGRRESSANDNFINKKDVPRARAKPRRRIKYNEEVRNFVVEAIASGLSDKQICKDIGISAPTFIKWKKEHEDLAAAIDEAESARCKAIFGKMMNCLDESKDYRGYKWLLTCYMPELYSDKKQIDHSVNSNKSGNAEVMNMLEQMKESND
jgi:predicted transcriptional regulator